VVDMNTRMLEFKTSKATGTTQPIVAGTGTGTVTGEGSSSGSSGSGSTGRVTLSMLLDVTSRQSTLLENVYEQHVVQLLKDCTEKKQLVSEFFSQI